MSDIECPYCGEEQGICHDDGHGLEEDKLHEDQCINCEKYFVFTTYIDISHQARPADCLNTDDDEHLWEATTTLPKEMTKMECRSCGDTRQPTEQEWAQIMGASDE